MCFLNTGNVGLKMIVLEISWSAKVNLIRLVTLHGKVMFINRVNEKCWMNPLSSKLTQKTIIGLTKHAVIKHGKKPLPRMA